LLTWAFAIDILRFRLGTQPATATARAGMTPLPEWFNRAFALAAAVARNAALRRNKPGLAEVCTVLDREGPRPPEAVRQGK